MIRTTAVDVAFDMDYLKVTKVNKQSLALWGVWSSDLIGSFSKHLGDLHPQYTSDVTTF